MTQPKQKLELTWIGKEQRPRLEPRILIEAPDRFCVGGAVSVKKLRARGDWQQEKMVFSNRAEHE